MGATLAFAGRLMLASLFLLSGKFSFVSGGGLCTGSDWRACSLQQQQRNWLYCSALFQTPSHCMPWHC